MRLCIVCKKNPADGLQCPECRTRPRGQEWRGVSTVHEQRTEAVGGGDVHLSHDVHKKVNKGERCEVSERDYNAVDEIISSEEGATLTLPWDLLASVNKRVNRVGDRVRLTRAYRATLDAAKEAVREQWPGDPLEGPVAVRFDFYPPDRRKRDCSNFVKLPEDAMTGAVYHDDEQIVDTRIRKMAVDSERPRVEVTMRAA